MSTHRHEPSPDGAAGRRASRMPSHAHRLMPGDRVVFDLFEGDDGPPYALNVALIDTPDVEAGPRES